MLDFDADELQGLTERTRERNRVLEEARLEKIQREEARLRAVEGETWAGMDIVGAPSVFEAADDGVWKFELGHTGPG